MKLLMTSSAYQLAITILTFCRLKWCLFFLLLFFLFRIIFFVWFSYSTKQLFWTIVFKVFFLWDSSFSWCISFGAGTQSNKRVWKGVVEKLSRKRLYKIECFPMSTNGLSAHRHCIESSIVSTKWWVNPGVKIKMTHFRRLLNLLYSLKC